jgi:hypothetical protein
MKSKINGVKWVDFRIEASGHGVVNWNGSVAVTGPDGKEINNHTIPKLRGFTNKTGKKKDGSDYEYKISADDIDVKKTPVYVSPECIKNNLFKEEAFNITFATDPESAMVLIPSIIGLLKGYVIASGNTSIGKKSPFLLESLTEIAGIGNFEQYSKFGSKKSDTSLFSKTTLGDTKYIGYGSLIIEDLFIPLDDVFGRKAALVPTVEEGVELAKKVTEFLKTLDFDGLKNPEANYNECYVRQGSLMKAGEAGIVLNEDGVYLVAQYLIHKLTTLHIRQGRGWLAVDKVVVDYNDSNVPMRIKKDIHSISEEQNSKFAVYYAPGDKESKDASEKMKNSQSGHVSKSNKKEVKKDK